MVQKRMRFVAMGLLAVGLALAITGDADACGRRGRRGHHRGSFVTAYCCTPAISCAPVCDPCADPCADPCCDPCGGWGAGYGGWGAGCGCSGGWGAGYGGWGDGCGCGTGVGYGGWGYSALRPYTSWYGGYGHTSYAPYRGGRGRGCCGQGGWFQGVGRRHGGCRGHRRGHGAWCGPWMTGGGCAPSFGMGICDPCCSPSFDPCCDPCGAVAATPACCDPCGDMCGVGGACSVGYGATAPAWDASTCVNCPTCEPMDTDEVMTRPSIERRRRPIMADEQEEGEQEGMREEQQQQRTFRRRTQQQFETQRGQGQMEQRNGFNAQQRDFDQQGGFDGQNWN